MDATTLYWITRLDELKDTMMGTALVVLIIGSIATAVMLYEINSIKALLPALIGGVLGLVLILGRPFIPTTKEAIVIYGVPAVVEYAQRHDVGGKAERVCDALLTMIETKAKDAVKGK